MAERSRFELEREARVKANKLKMQVSAYSNCIGSTRLAGGTRSTNAKRLCAGAWP
jgi:CHASE1-domain containing sensor protein